MALKSSEDKLKRGDSAPDFKLKGTDEDMHSLGELKGEKATLVVFMCNHCPYVLPKIKELNRIHLDFKDRGVRVIGINSNNHPDYPQDSFENMKELGVGFPYLFDETQDVAREYGAVCTPDPFLFDKDMKLIFHSRIDDTHGPEAPEKHEMYTAIEEYLMSGKITRKVKPSMGCSIKWRD